MSLSRIKLSFVVSMIALQPKVNPQKLVATQDFAMGLATGIPLYLDTFCPFQRNTMLVVPKVEKKDLSSQKIEQL